MIFLFNLMLRWTLWSIVLGLIGYLVLFPIYSGAPAYTDYELRALLIVLAIMIPKFWVKDSYLFLFWLLSSPLSFLIFGSVAVCSFYLTRQVPFISLAFCLFTFVLILARKKGEQMRLNSSNYSGYFNINFKKKDQKNE